MYNIVASQETTFMHTVFGMPGAVVTRYMLYCFCSFTFLIDSNQVFGIGMAQDIDIDAFLRKLANGNLNEARTSLGIDLWRSQWVNFASQPLSR